MRRHPLSFSLQRPIRPRRHIYMHATDGLAEAERAFLDECEAAVATFEAIFGRATAQASPQILAMVDPVAAVLRLCLDPTLQPGLLSLATAGRLDVAWE